MKKLIVFTGLAALGFQSVAQDKLYNNEFPLKDITLLEGPFQHARDLNIEVLLKYDVDRLLAGFRKQAGLPEKAKMYPNWDGLDGHVGGHYLTAMAMNYAATGNPQCKSRMEYMLAELKAIQEANGIKYPEWGIGYVGAVPNSEKIWSTFKKGDFAAYKGAWVPFYNVHKMYQGLRDAWIYTGNEEAKNIYLKFCDWAINITADLSDKQMESVLDMEHGGMNEVLADAYYLTRKEVYLTAARRYSHKMLLDPMAASKDNLDNKHANTQVPKAVGFERIGEVSNDANYLQAGQFFWETVTGNRTLAFGGNSRREFFPSVKASRDFIADVEGPETCNSYNMLKLTENLFRVQPKAAYTDYYERTVYNHILGSQHPEHGGYVYFTPARPRHYRVYSAPNEGMWCCVGSGMENHGKYNQFIYTHVNDSLYLNLFIPSELNWEAKKIKFRQETRFPEEEQTTFTVTEGTANLTLMVRYPYWAKKITLSVNGKKVEHKQQPSSYIAINRSWKKGDVVSITLPMETRVESMPNVPDYIAILHGPVLLSARINSDTLRGLVADDSRWGHIAGGKKLPVNQAPIIIEDQQSLIKKLTPVKGKPLTFAVNNIKMVNPVNVTLEPFYKIHDSRYMMYWMALNQKGYQQYLDSTSKLEKIKLDLQQRTVDFVAPGEQQPEADHFMQKENSNTGNQLDEFWRDARGNGYFSYQMTTKKETNLSLMVRYWGAEWGNRKFDIYIDDTKLVSEDNTGRWNQSNFQDITYSIPESMLKGKETIRVKFQAIPGNTAGAVYYVRLVRPADKKKEN